MQKLELTWIGKEKQPHVEPRILLHDPSKDYGDPDSQNMLIHGDNLLALKALEQNFAGRAKCIYIDPPYNSGNAFENYDDNLEHSTWLNLMRPRLEILHNLLSESGSIWISIDDDEGHYLKVLCDEIFGRNNFIHTIVWQKKYGPANDAKWISDSHDFILVYAKNKNLWHPNLLPRTGKQLKDYKNPDNDPRGLWRASDLSARTYSANCDYIITGPTGKQFSPPPTRAWIVSQTRFEELNKDNRIWWGVKKDARPMQKKFLSEVKSGITPESWWSREFAGDNKIAKYESKALFDGQSFDTPKPELLIEKVLILASNKGDLILDSFLGSGTTAAVAHKMGRRYIGIEMGSTAYSFCKTRLDKVIDGEQGGISKDVNWQGGGGYKFYELAPTLIEKDKYGNPIFSKKYNPTMLAAAVAKINGFTYAPDAEVYWKQGYSQEKSYIYVTTQYLTGKQLDSIAADVSDFEQLLICAPAFDNGLNKRYDNINIRKIPQSVLDKCEFGVDNYNLNIVNPPVIDEAEWEEEDE